MFPYLTLNEADVFHRFLNLPVRERADPLLLAIAGNFSAVQSVYCFLQLIVLAAGTYALFRRTGLLRIDSLCAAAIALLGIVTVVPIDPFALKFHWFPFLVYALDRSRLEKRSGEDNLFFKTAQTAVPIVLWWLTAGSIGVFGALLAPLVRLLLFKDQAESGAHYSFIAVLTVAGSLLFMPVYDMPSFPGDARLAPLSSLTLGHPTIGPDIHPLPIIFPSYQFEFSFAQIRYQGFLLGYLALFLLLALIPKIHGLFPHTRKIKVGKIVLNSGDWISVLGPPLAIFVTTYLFVFTPALSGRWSFRMPDTFHVLRNLIPGLALEPLPWLLAPFGVLLGSFMLAARGQASHRVTVLVMVTMTAAVTGWAAGPLEAQLEEDYFSSSPQARLRDEPQERASEFVGKVYGQWIFSNITSASREAELQRYSLGTDLNVTAGTSVNPDLANLMLDKNYSTRWATKRPQQPGDWVSFAFDRSIRIGRATLSIRNNQTDFPRGLRVEGTSDGSSYTTLYNFSDWLGPVEWIESGNPYFGLQSRVVIEFPEMLELRGLRFTLTAGDPSFDWSVGELLLWGPKTAPAATLEDDQGEKGVDRD